MQPTETSQSGGETRDININIRAKRTQRDLIDQAAELQGKSRSDFMLEIACREAEDVLLDQRMFTLDAETFKKFKALLDAPPSDNPKLRKLMRTACKGCARRGCSCMFTPYPTPIPTCTRRCSETA